MTFQLLTLTPYCYTTKLPVNINSSMKHFIYKAFESTHKHAHRNILDGWMDR